LLGPQNVEDFDDCPVLNGPVKDVVVPSWEKSETWANVLKFVSKFPNVRMLGEELKLLVKESNDLVGGRQIVILDTIAGKGWVPF
jgi:hypothetical protein